MNLKIYLPIGISLCIHIGVLFVFWLIELPLAPVKREISVVLVSLKEPEIKRNTVTQISDTESQGPQLDTIAKDNVAENVAEESVAATTTTSKALVTAATAAAAARDTVTTDGNAQQSEILESFDAKHETLSTDKDHESRPEDEVVAANDENLANDGSTEVKVLALATSLEGSVNASSKAIPNSTAINGSVDPWIASGELKPQNRARAEPVYDETTLVMPGIENMRGGLEDIDITEAKLGRPTLSSREIETPVTEVFTEAVIPVGSLQMPSPDDVLAQITSEISRGGVMAIARMSSSLGDSEIGWLGMVRKRKVLKRKAPVFPETLQAEGQEVDVGAKIAVSPAGHVTTVHITRSSGYAEVDNSVERALRGYLFEKSQNDDNDIGVVTFHFRLEKQE